MTPYCEDDATIERLACSFLEQSLRKASWTHAAHFAVTLWLLKHRPTWSLPDLMPGLIRTYNAASGGVNTDVAGYHETITQASIGAARAFLAAAPPQWPLHTLVDELMASPLGEKLWLLDYWSHSRLFSVEARRGWVEPDLKPLPFAL